MNEDKEDSEEESDVEILDVDLAIDVNKVETPQVCSIHLHLTSQHPG